MNLEPNRFIPDFYHGTELPLNEKFTIPKDGFISVSYHVYSNSGDSWIDVFKYDENGNNVMAPSCRNSHYSNGSNIPGEACTLFFMPVCQGEIYRIDCSSGTLRSDSHRMFFPCR